MRNSNRHHGIMFNFAICLGFVLVQLDVSIVNVGLNALSSAYGASVADLEWVINSYSLMFAALLISSGSLSDRFGAKNVFLFGVLIFIFSSLVCALSPTLIVLQVFRAIQGIGAALLVPTSMTLLGNYYSDQHTRAKAISLWAASGSMALAAGPIIGGVLIDHFGWRSIFLINIPVGLISMAITIKYAPKSETRENNLNIPGQVLVFLALGLLTFSLTESGKEGWQSISTIGTLIVGIIAAITFNKKDKKASNPVIPEDIRHNITIISSALIGFICNLIFYGSVFTLSLYFQKQMGMSSEKTGMTFLPMMVCVAISTYFSGSLGKKISVKMVVTVGGISCFTGFGLLSMIEASWSIWRMIAPMILIGVGTSLVVPGLAGLIMSEAKLKDSGSASAIFSCARQMGGVMGVGLFGSVLSAMSADAFTSDLKIICFISMALIITWVTIGRLRLHA